MTGQYMQIINRLPNLPKLPNLPQAIQRNWKVLLVLVGVIAVGAYWYLQSQTNGEPALNFQHPQRQTLVKTLEVSGVVDAKEKARMRFLAGGKITYLGAKEGDSVNRWQTIARVDTRTLQKQQEKNLNNYLIERWNWENTQDEIQDKALNDQERRQVDQEQFQLNNAVLDVEIQQIAIEENALYAPFSGVVTIAPAEVAGVQLAATDYFELVNPDTLIFRAGVDEADIANVAKEQAATVELDAYENQTFNTKVNYVAYTSSEGSTGTVFAVEMPLPNPDISTFRLGMSGDVEIELSRKENALTIPLIATRERNNKVYVDVKTGDNQYQERQIELGLETDDAVEVIDGLSEQDQVLIPQ